MCNSTSLIIFHSAMIASSSRKELLNEDENCLTVSARSDGGYGGESTKDSATGTTNNNEIETAKKEEPSHIKVGAFEIWALGLTVVIGGQYFSWNFALSSGFGSFAISTFLIGSAYICLVVSNAEITSALPFAGGAYGLARVCLGLYPGFLIGCCEAIEYIFYVAASALVLSKMLIDMTSASPIMEPIICLLFYIVSLLIHIFGGIWFWRSTTFLGVISLVIVLVYCFGSLPWVDFNQYAPAPSTTGEPDGKRAWFIGGFSAFFTTTPLAAWWYVGVESLNFCNSVVSEVSVSYIARKMLQ